MQRWSEMDDRSGAWYVNLNGELEIAPIGYVLLIEQSGTGSFRIGWLEPGEKEEELISLLQEGSPTPLSVIGRWAVPVEKLDTAINESNKSLKNNGDSGIGGWVRVYKDSGINLVDVAVSGLISTSFHLAGQHDQKSHGSWSTGLGDEEDSIDSVVARVNSNPKASKTSRAEIIAAAKRVAKSTGVSESAAIKEITKNIDASLAALDAGRELPSMESLREQVARTEAMKKQIAQIQARVDSASVGSAPKRQGLLGRIKNMFTGSTFNGVCVGSGCGVYVIQSGTSNRFKIGKTTNIEDRMKALQTGSPDALKLIGFIQAPPGDISRIESELHKKYGRNRIGSSGTAKEWFVLDPDEARRIAR